MVFKSFLDYLGSMGSFGDFVLKMLGNGKRGVFLNSNELGFFTMLQVTAHLLDNGVVIKQKMPRKRRSMLSLVTAYLNPLSII